MQRLNDVVEIKSGPNLSNRIVGPLGDVRIDHKLPIDPNGNVLIVQQGDITRKGISSQLQRINYEKSDRDRLRDGDVLLRSKGSPILAAEYKPGDELPTIAAAAVVILRPIMSVPTIQPQYLVWLLNSTWGQNMFMKIKTGTHISMIAIRDLQQISIPLPSIDEQNRICELSDLASRHEELAIQYREKIDELLVARTLDSKTART